jgi:lysophospholipase L1-like esterase
MKVLLLLSSTLIAGMMATTAPCHAKSNDLPLRNGDMEEGADGAPPIGWNGKFGPCEVRRDRLYFHGGKASLAVDRSNNTDKERGCAHQMLLLRDGPKEAETPAGAIPTDAKAPAPEPLKLKVGGWVKVDPGAKATFAAHFFDEKFTFSEIVPILRIDVFQDWTKGEMEIAVPPQATRVAIALYVEGQGRAWLDDVSVTSDRDIKLAVGSTSNVKAPKENKDTSKVPVTAVPGFFPANPEAWQAFHESFVRRAKEGNIDVLFLGDSITQGWATTGDDAWAKHFAPLKAVSFGLAGDKTGNVLWRIEHGELEGTPPKVVVLMIGVNNLWSGQNTGGEIAAGIRVIVEKLREKLPQSKVLVVGVLPVGADPMGLDRVRSAQINTEAAGIGNGAEVRFLDVSPRFVTRKGTLTDGAYAQDQVHLTAFGYDILAEELRPWVEALLK